MLYRYIPQFGAVVCETGLVSPVVFSLDGCYTCFECQSLVLSWLCLLPSIVTLS